MLSVTLVCSTGILAIWLVTWVLYFVAVVYSLKYLHVKPKDDSDQYTVGVSIAKPLSTASDPNLQDNLETFFKLDYPKFEILLCIENSADIALIKMVDDIRNKYPHVDTSVFIGCQEVTINPKVNNMMKAYGAAKYPLYFMCDSNLRVSHDTLKDMVSHMTDNVGVVHQLPLMCDGQLTFSRQLEQIWFGGQHSRIYVSANAMGINCTTGMSFMFRKKVIDGLGGLIVVGPYLGEDFFLAKLIKEQGWKVVICSQPAQQNAAITSVKFFQARMVRWLYTRFTEFPILVFLETFQEHVILTPLTALSLHYLLAVNPYLFIPVELIAWVIADYLMLSIVQNKRPAFSIFSYIRGWILIELATIFVIPQALRKRTIVWGGKRFLSHFGGKTERVYEEPNVSYVNGVEIV